MNNKRNLKNPTITKVEAVCPVCDRQVATYLYKGQRKIEAHMVTPFSGPSQSCTGAGRVAVQTIQVTEHY